MYSMNAFYSFSHRRINVRKTDPHSSFLPLVDSPLNTFSQSMMLQNNLNIKRHCHVLCIYSDLEELNVYQQNIEANSRKKKKKAPQISAGLDKIHLEGLLVT